MLKLALLFFLPLYLAALVWIVQSPGDSWELLLKISFLLVLGLGLVWAIARNTPDPEVNPVAGPNDCPFCQANNPASRLYCQACGLALYRFDAQGQMVSQRESHTELP